MPIRYSVEDSAPYPAQENGGFELWTLKDIRDLADAQYLSGEQFFMVGSSEGVPSWGESSDPELVITSLSQVSIRVAQQYPDVADKDLFITALWKDGKPGSYNYELRLVPRFIMDRVGHSVH